MSEPNPSSRIEQIESVLHEASVELRASEDWAPGWAALGQYFQQVVSLEADMERACREYLHGLSHRVNSYISWTKYHEYVTSRNLLAADDSVPQTYDVSVLFDDDSFKQDELPQVEAMIREVYINGVALGFAGERHTVTGSTASIPRTVESPIYQTIQNVAQEHIEQLGEWLDDGTRNLVVDAIQKSIALGESQELAMKRVLEVVDNPKRAEVIAQTEMVRAYSIGEETFAKDNGATTQTWEALAGADENSSKKPCVENNGVTVKVGKPFPSGDLRTPAHPRCRCKRSFHYPEGAIPA